MFFENNYIIFSSDLNINSISTYKNLMMKFINKFIDIKFNDYLNKNELYEDALIYAKYYTYYKTMNCIYSSEIMNIIYDVEFN